MFTRSFLIILVIFTSLLLCSLFFNSFGDEQENLTIGWFILKGLVPYRDFFFNHGPFPLYLSALVQFYIPNIPLALRIGIGLIWVAVLVGVWRLIDPKLRLPFGLTMILATFLFPLLNLQMFLADTLCAQGFLILLWLFLSYYLHGKPKTTLFITIAIVISVMIFWSSVAMALALGFFWLVALPLFIKRGQLGYLWNNALSLTVLSLGSLFSFPFYFFMRGAISEFFWSTFTWNTVYYFPYRLADNAQEVDRGVLFHFLHHYSAFLIGNLTTLIQSSVVFLQTTKASVVLLLNFPVNLTRSLEFESLALSEFGQRLQNLSIVSLLVIVLAVFFLTKMRRPLWALALIVFLGTLRFHDNEVFHLASFYLTILSINCLILVYSYRTKAFVFFVTATFLLGSFLLGFFPSFQDTIFERRPMIDSRDQIKARAISAITQSDAEIYSLTGETINYYLAGRLPATKWFFYLPWFVHVPEMQREVRQAIKTGKPAAVIVDEPPKYLPSSQNYYYYEMRDLLSEKYRYTDQGIYIRQ